MVRADATSRVTVLVVVREGNAISMTLGLTALTLRRMGITRAVSDDYVLPIRIGGVSHAPEVDVKSCAPPRAHV